MANYYFFFIICRPPAVVVDVEFQSLCQDLNLPETVKSRAWEVWQDLDLKPDETQVCWCVLSSGTPTF